ncbi:bifunctional 4-hydroxy-2-oxoglutarate aldolase/2-dehydro-3-deoxy-phosphogluconate aldolase [Bermanella marisrubri]|uniref:2-dehydro-3-deoxy-phosphogluconate aldolase n=1 Tax=Bermanella marisrubri TaxID=207949 RepID=Q1N5N7_9GAMM|nr:bifunctional 4-hydroxy-2-oxoglutarate aldolase/2-dehydro-3-deoxy-phosphogluconate aldolase [Bermanella marisrubri]EAT13905.1 keto-hydroxyglutarate-aldolase/keto-deoxy-phosphogluconate aldolase [Oceanobacter sp. RED65] [Bermanella marisrubri]QIZ84660.1 bifunctional 4-hydroxy-2-oxoglutarate aldolase/2-dehydro-3-deoxy-phosphogluconate aldolase [Bermanella marisrubri]
MSNHYQILDQWCAQSPVIPVITLYKTEHAVPLANALAKGGLSILEVTLRTDCALESIKLMREACPQLLIGAGSVLDTRTLWAAQEVGSQFIVSPGAGPQLLQALAQCQIPVLPGIASISEMLTGYELGLRRFKFFPANINGGVAALKAFSGPIKDVKFCPTGGVNLDNMNDYLALDNVFAVGGTWIVPTDLIEQENWQAITDLAKECLIKSQQVQRSL